MNKRQWQLSADLEEVETRLNEIYESGEGDDEAKELEAKRVEIKAKMKEESWKPMNITSNN